MDAEALVWLVIMGIWFISNVVKQIGRLGKDKEKPGQQSTDSPARQQRRQRPSPLSQSQSRSQPRSQPPPPVPQQVQQTPPPPPTTRPQPAQAVGEEMLRDLMKQLGVDVQPEPVEPIAPASEHRQAVSERRQDAAELQGTASEHRGTLSEHERSEGFVTVTQSEHEWSDGEHSLTGSEHIADASEHTWGDSLAIGELSRPATVVSHRRRGRVKRSNMLSDLRDRNVLARAFVLKEILGPPVALKGESERS